MRLPDIVAPAAVITRLQSNQRDAVVTELLDALVAANAAPAAIRDELLVKVLEREARGSTGFGRGVAVPHVKHKGVSKMAAAIGLSQAGIDFNSLDKAPVYSVFLLMSPEDRPEQHLQAMEVIFKNLSKDTFRRFLRQAGSPDEVAVLLEEADGNQIGS